ncbi:reverse transcriptase domain-containing protein [Tanacetum coccineum]
MLAKSEHQSSLIQKQFVDLQLKFQNYKERLRNEKVCVPPNATASNAIFEINQLKDQLQRKDDTIRNLETHINITRMLNVGPTTGSLDQQALETESNLSLVVSFKNEICACQNHQHKWRLYTSKERAGEATKERDVVPNQCIRMNLMPGPSVDCRPLVKVDFLTTLVPTTELSSNRKDFENLELVWCVLVIHTVETDMVKLVVEIECFGKSFDEFDEKSGSSDGLQPKKADLSCVHALNEPHLHEIHVVSSKHEADQYRGDGVASTKRRCRDFQSDVVEDFVTALERSHLKEDLEPSTWAELNYPELKKVILALVYAARRLRRYFQAHPIWVMTDKPIKQILARPEKSGRITKWVIELGEHDIELKGQGKDIEIKKLEEINEEPKSEDMQKLYTDGALSSDSSGAGLMLVSPEGKEYTYALRFKFESTNNKAKYKALLAGLRRAADMKIKD